MKKIFFIMIAAVLIFFTAANYSKSVNSDLSQNIVRLHVLANSDSKEDQALKLKVRDAILDYSREKLTAKDDVSSRLDAYKAIAEKTIRENGFDYTAEVEYGNFSFPTKKYANFTLPAGNYDAVRVKIGSAKGQNWWCVMFPPLCFVDGTTVGTSAQAQLKATLDKESFDIITTPSGGKKSPFEIKFKIVEFYGKLRGRDKVYTASK